MATTERTHLTLPSQTLAQLDQAAEAERRSRSNMASIAIEQYLAQRNAVTGESRLRDLERLAAQHLTGDPMADNDTDPMPVSVGSQDSPSTVPFGKGFITADEKVAAQNAGRQTQISQDCHNASKQHLADHLARTGGNLPGAK